MPFAALVLLKFPLLLTGFRQLVFGRKLSHVSKSNAKGKAIIIHNFRSGEVDRMNIDDSCKLFSFESRFALNMMMLPVHFLMVGGGRKDCEQLRFCLGGGAEHA